MGLSQNISRTSPQKPRRFHQKKRRGFFIPDPLGSPVAAGKAQPLSLAQISNYGTWRSYLHTLSRSEITATQYDAPLSAATSKNISAQNHFLIQKSGIFAFE